MASPTVLIVAAAEVVAVAGFAGGPAPFATTRFPSEGIPALPVAIGRKSFFTPTLPR